VKRRLIRWMFGVFRNDTRERFGVEFEDLVDELIRAGEARWSVCFDVGFAGVRDRLSAIGRRGRAGIATGITFGTAISVAAWALTLPVPKPPPYISSAEAQAIFSISPHPTNLPAGTQITFQSCPTTPALSKNLLAGETIPTPSLVPTNTYLSAAGQTHSFGGICQYTVTIP
jgi:hypothetical protein